MKRWFLDNLPIVWFILIILVSALLVTDHAKSEDSFENTMKKILIPILVVLGVVAYGSLFVVQEISQAIVLQFGDPKKIVTKAGSVSYTHLRAHET